MRGGEVGRLSEVLSRLLRRYAAALVNRAPPSDLMLSLDAAPSPRCDLGPCDRVVNLKSDISCRPTQRELLSSRRYVPAEPATRSMEPYEKKAHAKANRRVPKYTGAEDPWTRRALESVRFRDVHLCA